MMTINTTVSMPLTKPLTKSIRQLIAGLAAGATLAGAAVAAPVEANRYQNSDGIEVLTSRGSPASIAAPGATQPAPAAQPAQPLQPAVPAPAAVPVRRDGAAAGRGWAAPAAAAPITVAHQVDAGLQAERDRDRRTILMQELVNEGRALEARRQTLRSPRSAVELTEEQLRALREQIARHEGNVLALNQEIARLRLPASLANANASARAGTDIAGR